MTLPSINLNKHTLSSIEEALAKEWIITNGLGGYASSTVLGVNTRKYHGLLVAAFNPPRNRKLCLAKLDEELKVENRSYPLFCNEFQGEFSPKRCVFPDRFCLSPFPKYFYAVENVSVVKTIFMPYRRNAIIVLYEILNRGCSNVKMQIFPAVTDRHFHSTVDRRQTPLEFMQKTEDKKVMIQAPSSITIIEATNGSYHRNEKWIERVFFREEFCRGESFLDDWYQPGFFEVTVNSPFIKFAITTHMSVNENRLRTVSFGAPSTIDEAERLYDAALLRSERLLSNFYEGHSSLRMADWLSWLVLAADAFIVEVAGTASKSVIAGYHWFEDWGRDAFISLPGLMLVTERFEDARQTFLTFNKYSWNGLIPNYVSDKTGQPAYNSVDTTLWYVNAVLQYLKYTGDLKFVEMHLWEDLKAIVDFFLNGTAFNIRVDADGLLMHGPQLTWMDTVVDGQPVTPRAGKAVEVQALWYNALKALEGLARRFGDMKVSEKFAHLAEKAGKSFLEKFWNNELGCLFDVLDERGIADASVRPNQIIAVSLDFTMLDNARSEKVVDFVHREFLTPFGLRTLAVKDSKYVGVYFGDRRSRDLAYHNGAVWPWLLGSFIKAYLKTKGCTEKVRQYVFENYLFPLFDVQVFNAGLGTISEIFDGDLPHKPRGCIAQAWSVAEPLRVYMEDVMQIKPKHERIILEILSGYHCS